ncbi:hypothetical protein DFH06DRAFT_438919 [Mycena polygramma]|nr:hypothetical protein DFH06DRAFT_438919 [Mycena polygramma]
MLAALEAERGRLAQLEAQIIDTERSLFALRAEKASVQERLDAYTYPVLTLPNEITSEIFIHFLPIYPLCPPLVGSGSPNLLTQICQRWRDIALVTPELWRAISFFSRHAHLGLERIYLWLGRSGCCPLSIRVEDNNNQKLVSEVLGAFILHRARWEYVELGLSLNLLFTIEGPMPLLYHLDLLIIDSDPTKTISLREAPLLRTVILYSVPAEIMLPWAQLTSLTLNRVYPHQCVPILQQSSNLKYCELVLDKDVSGGHAHIPDVTLPLLESLKFRGSGFLDTLITPALRRLELPERILAEHPFNRLIDFITRAKGSASEGQLTYRICTSQAIER